MNMLRQSDADVHAQIVRDTLGQYREVIGGSLRSASMKSGYDAEAMKFLMEPKHWKRAREIVSTMKEAESNVVQELWHEVGLRLKKKGRLLDPQYFIENNYTGIWSHVANWLEYAYFDVGQGVEGGRRYLYCELDLEKADRRSGGLLKKFKAASIGDLQFGQDSDTHHIYREFTAQSEPEDWPMNGNKGVIDLANELAQKSAEFLSDAGQLIKRGKRSQ
jgi:hypothetical protein